MHTKHSTTSLHKTLVERCVHNCGKKMEYGQGYLSKLRSTLKSRLYLQFNDHIFTEGRLEIYLNVLMKKHIPECTDDKTLDDSLMAVTTTGDIPKVYAR